MPTYFSIEGRRKADQEIADLEKVTKKIYAQINEVCDGDWHDNAGYDYLHEQVQIQDKKIQRLKEVKKDSAVIEYPKKVTKVVLGSEVQFYRDEKEFIFRIVAHGDENLEDKRIRYDTPIAQILIGHVAGEEYKSMLMNKPTQIKILEVNPLPFEFRNGYK